MGNYDLVSNFDVVCGSRWISLTFAWEGRNVRIILVYASNVAAERLALWEDLNPLLSFPGAIVFLGDFNEILNPEERKGCFEVSASMLRFSSFVNRMELIDLPLHRRRYTWSKPLLPESICV